jgi:hypothetical protein
MACRLTKHGDNFAFVKYTQYKLWVGYLFLNCDPQTLLGTVNITEAYTGGLSWPSLVFAVEYFVIILK